MARRFAAEVLRLLTSRALPTERGQGGDAFTETVGLPAWNHPAALVQPETATATATRVTVNRSPRARCLSSGPHFTSVGTRDAYESLGQSGRPDNVRLADRLRVLVLWT